ncbi:uncharacterized protein ACHE_10990S [Aspergillus chevalieri]|uniref:Uncharacterized protein n=1 Tax=Aspergillus chevalieri TaxID=182096 RepID=A0A7R7VGV7_ASPCH|nr:uncharacterized protein ACHE_10990S [Aspergillus chevalieri]BCR83588.1 hypothetical protein ACHE_10990S [Aspergillus chevalieri]
MNYLPPTVEDAKKMTSDPDIVEATDYYKTGRGQAPCGATSGLFFVGSVPDGFGTFRDAHEIHARAGSKEKHLVELPGVTHYKLYDESKAVKAALDEVLPFLKKHFNEVQ